MNHHVCFDLDHTLVDDTGDHLRPGMRELLDKLLARGVVLSLWTGSTEERALEVLRRHALEDYFSHCVFRDDYDPDGAGHPKDITYLGADLLVDDSAENIAFVRARGLRGFQISRFVDQEQAVDSRELAELWQWIVYPSLGSPQ